MLKRFARKWRTDNLGFAYERRIANIMLLIAILIVITYLVNLYENWLLDEFMACMRFCQVDTKHLNTFAVAELEI